MAQDEAEDAERFRALFQTSYDAVYRYAVRRVSASAAADVTAEVFLVAWRRIAEVPSDALPWLDAVARRVVANQRRSELRAARLAHRVRTVAVAERGVVVDATEASTDFAVFAAAFGRMAESDREVLALVGWEGLNARQAAAVLGCSVGALTMRLTRARRRLRAGLSGTEEGE